MLLTIRAGDFAGPVVSLAEGPDLLCCKMFVPLKGYELEGYHSRDESNCIPDSAKGGRGHPFRFSCPGDSQADSDWDILILINGVKATGEDFNRFAYPFVDYGWSVGEQIHPLIYCNHPTNHP